MWEGGKPPPTFLTVAILDYCEVFAICLSDVR